jgi:hypothetical protein
MCNGRERSNRGPSRRRIFVWGSNHSVIDRKPSKWHLLKLSPQNLPRFQQTPEMDLMNVHRMQFARGIDDSPMLKGSDLHVRHWVHTGREFLAVYVKNRSCPR